MASGSSRTGVRGRKVSCFNFEVSASSLSEVHWRGGTIVLACAALAAAPGACRAQASDGALPTPANEAASGMASPGVASGRPGYDGAPVDPGAPVRVIIDSPAANAIIPGPEVSVRVRGENYRLCEGGNRLQVVLDNRRSVLVYDTAAPVVFTNLLAGGHMLRVFAVAGDGRFVAGDGAFAACAFHSLRQGVDNLPEPGEPVLTVCSPRGTYVGEAAALIVFDYRVHGVTLSPIGYRLRFLVDGRERITHEPGPVFLPALGPGTHRLVAEIVDMDDVAVPGIYSRVGTTFDVKPASVPEVETQPVPAPR